jgi:hypothetical protein
MNQLVGMRKRWWYGIDDEISARIANRAFLLRGAPRRPFTEMLFRGAC